MKVDLLDFVDEVSDVGMMDFPILFAIDEHEEGRAKEWWEVICFYNDRDLDAPLLVGSEYAIIMNGWSTERMEHFFRRLK